MIPEGPSPLLDRDILTTLGATVHLGIGSHMPFLGALISPPAKESHQVLLKRSY
jgi:hypothetical protein